MSTKLDLSQTLKSMSKYDNLRMLAPIGAGHRILNALNEIFRVLNINATVVERGRLKVEQLPDVQKTLFTPGDGSIIVTTTEKKFAMRLIPICTGTNKQANVLQVDIIGLHAEQLCYFTEEVVAIARILGQGFTVSELSESSIARITKLCSTELEAVRYAVFN